MERKNNRPLQKDLFADTSPIAEKHLLLVQNDNPSKYCEDCHFFTRYELRPYSTILQAIWHIS